MSGNKIVRGTALKNAVTDLTATPTGPSDSSTSAPTSQGTPATAIQETGGPTTLAVKAIAALTLLYRNGSNQVVGETPAQVLALFATLSAAFASVATAPVAFAALPAGTAGMRAFINNSSVAAAGNFGAAAAGGGANTVPVYYDGAAWRIG